MKKKYQTEEDRRAANRDRQKRWYEKNAKQTKDFAKVFEEWIHEIGAGVPDIENPSHLYKLKKILMELNWDKDRVSDILSTVNKFKTKHIGVTMKSGKTGKEYRISRDNLKRELDRRGSRDITGKNFADEPAHNAKDAGATRQGYVFTKEQIRYANNGDFLDWETMMRKWVCYGDIPGTVTKNTSYWGVGSSKFTMYSDGMPHLTGHYDGDSFYVREFQFNCMPDMLTRSTIRNLVGGVDPNKNYGDGPELANDKEYPCTIVEYEVTEDEYRHMTHAEEFEFLPTHFVSIRRYADSTKVYSAKDMAESLNFAFMGVDTEQDTIFVKVAGGQKYYTSKKFYPTVTQHGKNFMPVSKFRDLPKVKEQIQIADGVFDVYLYQSITKINHDDSAQWYDLQKFTNKGKDVIKLKGRGVNPRHIYVNHRGIHLIQEDAWMPLAGYKYREETQNTVLVLHETSGDKEWPTIKTSGVDDETREMACQIHNEEIGKNKSIQYVAGKQEDKKVDTFVNRLNSDKNEDVPYKNGSMIALSYMCEEHLSRTDILDSNNRSVRETLPDGREYDLLLSKDDKYLLHLEFQNGTEDWPHIDQILSKILSGTAYYNVLVTDSLAGKKQKRDYFKRVLKDNNINACVWLCTNEELIEGDVDRIQLIHKPKQKVEVAA